MIRIVCPVSRSQACVVVESALQRSCGRSLVHSVSLSELKQWLDRPDMTCWVFIDPLELWSDLILQTLETTMTKVLLLGAIPASLAIHLEARLHPLSAEAKEAAMCGDAPANGFTESTLRIQYVRSIAGVDSPFDSRPFLRFDFMDEWNNLGFGAISTDGSIWSMSQLVDIPRRSVVAEVRLGQRAISAFSGLWDWERSSLFWINRSVGLPDSHEYRLLEAFLSGHRPNELPCWPVIAEIPYGYDAAVTMRLDCDEEVESARELWTTYRNLDIPFSLALHTNILSDKRNHRLPCDVAASGGGILSHSATHSPNWGGSYEAAFRESIDSRSLIKEATGQNARYAVSPFHQTPIYAREALADAGYHGCVGGIIRNDPDFLMARAGTPPGSPEGFISHSQQCMLHGDCLLEDLDPLALFKQSFNSAKAGRTFFAYLDHPFSPRYQYGWTTETQRIAMHESFVSHMRESSRAALFLNENDALDFLSQKAAIRIIQLRKGFQVEPSPLRSFNWPVSIDYKGEVHKMEKDGITL